MVLDLKRWGCNSIGTLGSSRVQAQPDDSHERILIKHGISELAIQSALRIASMIHAVAKTLAYDSVDVSQEKIAV